MTLDIGRYLDSTGEHPLLEEYSGMTIEQIHESNRRRRLNNK
jgi:hypothetical protein